MSTYWGYHCRTCHDSSDHWVNHGDAQLAALWDLRHCVATLHGNAGGTVEVELLGHGAAPAAWVVAHWQHDVVLENEYGDRTDPATGADARRYQDCDCHDPVLATAGYEGDEPAGYRGYRLRLALEAEARRLRVEPDWDRWHWWDTGQGLAAHVPPGPRPPLPHPHHGETLEAAR